VALAHLECLVTNSVATAGLSVGAIIGVVICALVVVAVLAVGGVVFARKMKHVARRSGDRNGAGVIGDVRL
jgi:predicted RND superfamily exporter protein